MKNYLCLQFSSPNSVDAGVRKNVLVICFCTSYLDIVSHGDIIMKLIDYAIDKVFTLFGILFVLLLYDFEYKRHF